MKILVVSQYFWPESFVINDLVETLAIQGHELEVLTGKPNYPDGVVFAGYNVEGLDDEQFRAGVRVRRVPLRPRGVGGAKNLSLNYCSFVWNGLRHFSRLVKGGRYDVIFVFAPSPIFAAIPAIWLKWRTKTHLAIWIQDLWPESLSATGFVQDPFVLRVVGFVVRAIYACADTLLIQSHAFRRAVATYAREDKIVYYPNSYRDGVLLSDGGAKIPEALLALLDENFCLLFAGNLGTAQSLETIVGAAERLRHLSKIRFVVVGSGSMQGWLEAQKREKMLDNLILAGRFSPADMPDIFRRAAGLIVTLKQERIFSFTIPSKIQAYLAAGRPLVGALDGEGARVILDAKAGLASPAEDVAGLTENIEKLFRMSNEERARLGEAARTYYLQNFEMEHQARRLVEIFVQRIQEREGSGK